MPFEAAHDQARKDTCLSCLSKSAPTTILWKCKLFVREFISGLIDREARKLSRACQRREAPKLGRSANARATPGWQASALYFRTEAAAYEIDENKMHTKYSGFTVCPFWRVFCFPCFWKIWHQAFKLWGFWFRRRLGGLFENFVPSPGIFFAHSDYDHEYFLKLSFLFSKAEPVLLVRQLWQSPGWAKHFGVGSSKSRMKTWLPDVGEIERRRTNDRRCDWYESLAVIHGPKRKKKQRSQRVIVRSLNPSSSSNHKGRSHKCAIFVNSNASGKSITLLPPTLDLFFSPFESQNKIICRMNNER